MPLFSAASALSFLFLIKYLPFTFQLPSIYLVILDFSNSIFLILPIPCSFYFVPFGLSLYKFCLSILCHLVYFLYKLVSFLFSLYFFLVFFLQKRYKLLLPSLSTGDQLFFLFIAFEWLVINNCFRLVFLFVFLRQQDGLFTIRDGCLQESIWELAYK